MREREVTGVALAKAATRQIYQLLVRSIPASFFPSLLSTVTADNKKHYLWQSRELSC